MTKFEDRFARQNPFEPPSRFLVTSPYSVIVHHLSGLSRYTLTRILQPLVYKNWSILISILFTFIAQTEHFLLCLLFVYILNSLARVSRRDNKLYFIKTRTLNKRKRNTPAFYFPSVFLIFFFATITYCFPFNNFSYSFTLFSECFSSFVHTTCSLSVCRVIVFSVRSHLPSSLDYTPK